MLDQSAMIGYTLCMSRIEDAIRKAIDADKRSRYALCKLTGIDQGHMCRFMSGATRLSFEAIERLVDVLGLTLELKRKKGR